MREHIAWRGGDALPAAGIWAAHWGGVDDEEIEMKTTDCEPVASTTQMAVLFAEPAVDAASGREDAIVFEATRTGMLNTTAGAARVALRLQVHQCGGGRLVAIMIAVGVTEHGTWNLRRISVPADQQRPGDAARTLGAMLPGIVTDMPDGRVLMCDDDGAVRAEVVSLTGRLSRARATEAGERRTQRRANTVRTIGQDDAVPLRRSLFDHINRCLPASGWLARSTASLFSTHSA